jgi:lipopolysaccharide export system protein LptA
MKLPDINQTVAILFLALTCTLSHAERADRDKPVHLESDQGNIDDSKQISTFEGKVLLTQGTMAIHGDKLVVVQDQNGFSHGTATGHLASFRQKREGLDEYVEGYGERIEYDSLNETVDFFGQARITRNQDDVRGDHITYNSKTEIFQVHGAPNQPANAVNKGRVHATLQPKPKLTVPATVTPQTEALPMMPSDTLSQPNDQGNSPAK